VIDAYAEKYRAHSSYAYCLNDPINNIDLKGDSTIKGAGFWQNALQGVQDGFNQTKNFINSLTTSQGWTSMAIDGSVSASQTGGPVGQAGQNATGFLSNTPNMTQDDWGHAIGFGGEKLGEGFLLSKGAGMLGNALKATTELGDGSSLFHSTSSTGATSSIMSEGINPAYFNSSSRFGGGFYMSTDVSTSTAELSFHNATVANTIEFNVASTKNFLNATSPVLDFGTKFAPKLLSGAAKTLGKDGIIFNSLRGSGTNVVQFKNFGLLTNGRVVH